MSASRRSESGPRFARRVRAPRALHALVGESPRIADLVGIGAAAIAGGATVLLLGAVASSGVEPWRRAAVALVAADAAGGAVATFTTSTVAHYAGKAALRRLFIALHAAHPTVLAALFPASAWALGLTGMYSIAGAFAVDALPGGEDRKVTASVLCAAGIVLFSFLGAREPLVAWFAPVFLVKLVLGAAGRRHPSAD